MILFNFCKITNLILINNFSSIFFDCVEKLREKKTLRNKFIFHFMIIGYLSQVI